MGCLLGGAIGDALGAPFEGLWSEDIPAAVDLMSGFSIFQGYPSGQFTDDTQLTLATIASITNHGYINPSEIAKSIFALWKNQTVIGPGGACGFAASEYFLHRDWRTCGAPKGNAGNGTAMRVAALGFCFLENPEKLPPVVGDICRITHHDSRSIAGGVAIAQASLYLCQHERVDVIELSENLAQAIVHINQEMARCVLDFPALLEKDEDTVLNQIAWAGMKYPEFDKPIITPFVVPTVLASLWAVVNHLDSWSAAVASAIKLGGDVDTLGAIVGGLMGVRLGLDSIPSRLREQVVASNYLRRLAEKYYNLICDKSDLRTVLKMYGC